MDIYKYQSNSHKSKEAKKKETIAKSKRVVSGKAKVRKKNDLIKFANIFIQEDIENIKNYIIQDVLIPNIKRTISESRDILLRTISESTDIFLYGESSGIEKNGAINYRKCYEKNKRKSNVNIAKAKNRYEFNNIIFDTRSDAEEVLSEMRLAIKAYDFVSVFDMYDFSGLQTDHIDMKYGWADLQDAMVTYTMEGYIIKLPRPLPLD